MIKKHYRVLIKKDECLNRLRYYPQIRFLWFWCNLFEWPIVSFKNYESAYKCVKQHIFKYNVVNYDYQVVNNNG
jgi:hypothetical protein